MDIEKITQRLQTLWQQVQENEALLFRHAKRHDAGTAADPLTITSSAHARQHALQTAADHTGTISATQHGTIASGDLHTEYTTALTTHAGASDPHTGYQKESEREAASGYAGLDASSKVIKDPANATATPTASKIPIADAGGKLAAGWIQEVLAYADLTDDPYADHNARHEPGGADPMAVDAADATGSLRTIGTGAHQACSGNDGRLYDNRVPVAHHAYHEPGGTDPMAVDAAAATGSLRTLGTAATAACAGNDARLSDARTPTAHGPSKHTEGTAWRMTYQNADGDETEIALGADGTVLTSAGVAAAPAFEAAGGGTVAVYEAGVQVVAAASVLDFNAGFDIVDAGSGHADISLDLTEATWTFAQGGFYFRDASGPLLYTGASGDDLFLTGDLDVSGHMALGASAALSLVNILTVNETISGGSQQQGIYVNLTGDANTFLIAGRFAAKGTGIYGGQYTRGLYGGATTKESGGAGIAEGLVFQAIADAGAATVARLSCIVIDPQDTATQAGALTLAEGIRIGVGASWPGVKPATVKGVYIAAALSVAGVTTAYGLHIEDLAATTVYLLEIGPATPYLRLVGGAAPAANQTNLYLAEGVTPTLRRVQWKNPDAAGHLAATDKVLVLV